MKTCVCPAKHYVVTEVKSATTSENDKRILDNIYYNTFNDENVDYYHTSSRVYCFVHEAQMLEVEAVKVYRISSLR